jgi:hypothetical protein
MARAMLYTATCNSIGSSTQRASSAGGGGPNAREPNGSVTHRAVRSFGLVVFAAGLSCAGFSSPTVDGGALAW